MFSSVIPRITLPRCQPLGRRQVLEYFPRQAPLSDTTASSMISREMVQAIAQQVDSFLLKHPGKPYVFEDAFAKTEIRRKGSPPHVRYPVVVTHRNVLDSAGKPLVIEAELTLSQHSRHPAHIRSSEEPEQDLGYLRDALLALLGESLK